MTSREKFEAFLVSEYEWGNDALNAANFHGDDATGYYTGGDFIYDGQSCSECLFWAWRGWQAAELASEQKLTDMAVQLANAESKCRELAAENAALKSFGDKLYSMYKGLETSGGGFHDEQSIPYQQAALDAAISAFEEIKTPATDDFLAEVRAQSASELIAAFSKHVSASVLNDSSVVTILECEDAMQHVAAQLRKGAAL